MISPAREPVERFEAQPGPQAAFLSCPADIAIFGGAAGGSKSFSLALEPLRNVHVPGFNAIVFRRTRPELIGGGSLWEQTCRVYPGADGRPREHSLDWRFPSGATVQLDSMQYEADVREHQSKRYALIEFDELTHFTSRQFWFMVGRNGSTCGVRPYIRAGCNPDPDSFVRPLIDWWIGPDGLAIPERSGVIRWLVRADDGEIHWHAEPEPLAALHPGKTPLSFTFIRSKLEDNAIFVREDPAYRSKLEALPRIDRERLLHGNWNARASASSYFRRSMFEYVDAAPADAVVRARAWDRAATKPSAENQNPDWTVGVRMSRDRTGIFYVEHVERLREGPLGVERAITSTAAGDGKRCTVAQWQDPGSAGKSEVAHYARLLPQYDVRTERAAEDKETYAKPFSAQCEAGNVRLVRGAWNEPYLATLEAFPTKGAHDDDVDASSLAYLFCANSDLEALRIMSKR